MSEPHRIPFGTRNVIDECLLPDLTTTFKLYGMHARQVNSNWSFPEHSHPRLFEVNFLLHGSQTMEVSGQPYSQSEGDLIFIPPDTPHRCFVTSSPDMSFFCLHFHIEDEVFHRSMLQLKDVLYLSDSRMVQTIRPTLQKLAQLTRSPQPLTLHSRMKIHEAAFQLLACLSEFIVSVTEQEREHESEDHQLTCRIAAWLEQSVNWSMLNNANPDISKSVIQSISREFGVSKSNCYRLFQKVYGISPRQYLTDVILREAKQLLKGDMLSIQEISDQLGYRNTVCFSRQFKRWTGLSPSGYRDQTQDRRTDFRLETNMTAPILE
ncbi:helix-turn-helix domain-containing protein [Paenibacillus koleovorans]|uniref:helix-turn-helix domain-containing protein n=1 Tax=Paenibacillus koleovorans TaxID=121608 RepID=UPI000FD9AE05|nr:AraC family transcriptional regulator [Paenibacillus koleovorans]